MGTLIVLSSSSVFGEPPTRPVLPAGTEIRVPGGQPYILAEPHKLIDAEARDEILAQLRLNEVLAADLVECNQALVQMSDPPRPPQWLVAAKYISLGAALAGSFTLGLWAGGAL